MKKISDDDINNILDEQRVDVEEFQRKRSEKRLQWLKYYRQDPYGNEADGWSQVISSAVYDAVEGLRPNLLERFTGNWFKLKADSQEKAELNQKLIRYQLYQHNKFERILDQDFIYNVLNTEFAILKAYYTEEYREGKQQIPRMTQKEMQALEQNDKVEIKSSTPVEEYNVSGEYWSGFEDVNIIVKEQHFKGFKIESVPGSEFYISSDAKSVETARFVEHRVPKTLDYVKKMEKLGVYRQGVTALLEEKLGSTQADNVVQEEIDDRIEHITDALMGVDTTNELVKPNAPLVISESYLRLDLTGEGVLEPVVIATCEDVILAIQENKYVRPPFFICAGFPRAHRIDGTCLGEILEHEQKEATMLRRLMLDGFAQSTYKNPVTPDQTLLNAINQRTPRDGILGDFKRMDWIETPPPSQGIFKALEHSANAMEEKTPYSRMAQGSTDAGNALNKTASGMNMVLSAAARKERLLARRIARCLEDVIRFCLWINEKISPPLDFDKIIGVEKQLTADDLFKDGEYDIEVVVGLGAQDRIEAAQILDQLIQFDVQAGLPMGIVTPDQIAETIRKKHKLLDVPVDGLIQETEVIKQQLKQKEQQQAQQTEQMQQQLQQMQQQLQKITQELHKKAKEVEVEQTKSQLKEIEHNAEIKLLNTAHKMEKTNDKIIKRATS